jgi:hypothetical protein
MHFPPSRVSRPNSARRLGHGPGRCCRGDNVYGASAPDTERITAGCVWSGGADGDQWVKLRVGGRFQSISILRPVAMGIW